MKQSTTLKRLMILLTLAPAAALLPQPADAQNRGLPAALLASADSAGAERELRAQRSEAQKERQQQRTLRNQELADATLAFRTETSTLEAEYKERARSVDTEFKLEEVGLRAEIDARVAGLEAELQKRFNANLMVGGEQDLAARLQAMEQETKAHQDRLFEARREGAASIHAARIRAEERKDALFREMEERALARAAELGLTTPPEPILATPIGGELTRQEAQWNEREQTEVERTAERNAKLLARFRTGERLRAWERANLAADFELEWQERRELHVLQSQESLFNVFMLQPAGAEGFDQQAFMDRLAENAEQQRLIKIRYEQTRRENAIKRREEKRSITET
jgi:hypothetical protein